VQSADSSDIADDAVLYRWIIGHDSFIRRRDLSPTRVAFQNSRDQDTGQPLPEMSFVLGPVLEVRRESPHDALVRRCAIDGRDPSEVFIAAVRAGEVRRLGFGVVPSIDDSEPAHGDITGFASQEQSRALAKLAVWFKAPPLGWTPP
jgi:hypothetical protein